MQSPKNRVPVTLASDELHLTIAVENNLANRVQFLGL
jgi:hypothetical protein